MSVRTDIRNLAIVAHVDHGKTTLIDAMLRQSGTFRSNETVQERVMDSNPLERERGITIFSKHASIQYAGVKINIIDTPGHADFGGEVERILQMVDGILLLVDAAEGPLPQTKFVLRKALERGLKAVVIVNKIDRPDAEPHNTLDKIFDLFVALGATDEQLDFSVLYASSRQGFARTELDDDCSTLIPLFDAIVRDLPGPDVEPDKPLQLLVTNTDHSDYLGRLAIGRITRGNVRKSQSVTAIRFKDQTLAPFRVTALYTYEGLKRQDVEVAEAGDIVVLAGLEDIFIGDTVADSEFPEALPGLSVDEPTLNMIFSVNNSPFAGKEGQYVTTRHLRDRLYREALTNLSLRVEDTDSPDSLKVSGRGELHLAILIETMRREGYEFQVSKPEVILHNEGDKVLEPYEELTLDVAQDLVGSCIERLGQRKAEMVSMHTTPDGHTRVVFMIPSRCLVGFRSEFLTITRGEGLLNHMVAGYQAYKGGTVGRTRGVLVASDPGTTTAYALFQLSDRGEFFIDAGEEVYTGMFVGEHSRDSDLCINVSRTKAMSNMRSKSADEALTIQPPRKMSLEQKLEYLNDDELLEITPKSLRLRKKILDATERKRDARSRERMEEGQE
ncbi:MAG: translational GTPase TypA [Candidatus Firestonebacteria bacterium]|nr:translational GTPase TypA [Candidatus Firestonebacteria bacterium]